jgi:glycosyltransferase involved in cell wall biosynthesis
MRVALASQEYPPETAHGGIGSQTYLKAHGLAGLGHEVFVISLSPDEEPKEYLDGQVRVIRIPSGEAQLAPHTEPVQWLTYSVAVAAAVARLHERLPLDVVDFPEWGCEGFVHLLNRSEWNYIPTVVHLHGPLVMFAHKIGWPEIVSEFYRIGTVMEGTCLRLADGVFSSSRCSADWCARHYAIPREGIAVLHTGVDTRLFRPVSAPKDRRPTIIFAGNIVENKGVVLLVEAACRLAPEFPDLQLRLLGRGREDLIEELHARAAAAGYPGLLDVPGFVRREELPRHLSRAHVFAAPSVYEGGPGFVYLEAMACGLPVIACEGSGVTEVVQPEDTGFLVPPEDVSALVGVLRRLLGDPVLANRIGRQARRYVEAEADSAACLKRLETFYAEATARGREAPRRGSGS